MPELPEVETVRRGLQPAQRAVEVQPERRGEREAERALDADDGTVPVDHFGRGEARRWARALALVRTPQHAVWRRHRRARPDSRHAQPRAATRDRLPSRGAGGGRRWQPCGRWDGVVRDAHAPADGSRPRCARHVRCQGQRAAARHLRLHEARQL